MLALMNPELLRTADTLRDQFQKAAPFPHLVLDGFFAPTQCDALMRDFPAFERGCSINEHGRPGGKATIEDMRGLGGSFIAVDDLFRSAEFSAFMSAVTGIPDLLYDPEYIGGGTHENRPGQQLDPHIDFNYHPTRGWHRRINLIIYLNDEWSEQWGGSLELHEDPWLPPQKNHVRRVSPIKNRAILFETSERSWHGFEAIQPPNGREQLSRKSIALYMYTKLRPKKDTAPPHSTVYVERPLPFLLEPGQTPTREHADRANRMLRRREEHIERISKREREFAAQTIDFVTARLASGAPMRAEDIALLERVFAREDALLRTLYDRETEFTGDLLQWKDGLAAARLTRPGTLEVTGAPVGFHSGDSWAEPCVELNLRATGNVRTLVLHGDLPELVGKSQTLTCSVGQHTVQHTLADGTFAIDVPVDLRAGDETSLTLRASTSICPARQIPGSADVRALSYRLYGVTGR